MKHDLRRTEFRAIEDRSFPVLHHFWSNGPEVALLCSRKPSNIYFLYSKISISATSAIPFSIASLYDTSSYKSFFVMLL